MKSMISVAGLLEMILNVPMVELSEEMLSKEMTEKKFH